MKLRGIIVFFVIALSTGAVALANGDGTSAVDFLNIDVSARTAATGEALSALADGPSSAYYNPAGLADIGIVQVAGMHAEWLQDLRYEYLGAAFPMGQNGGLGLSVSYLSMGEINGYSSTNTAAGDVSAYDMAVMLSYGRRISPMLSAGLGVKGIAERLDNITAYGFAADVGGQYHLGRIDAGLAIRNLGPRIKYSAASSNLPTSVDAGISFRPFGQDLALLAGLNAPFAGNAGLRTGIEYTYMSLLVLRGGYDTADRGSGRSGMSLGCGLNVLTHSLDYAYNVNRVLGGTHQISFVLRLGAPRAARAYIASADDGVNDKSSSLGAQAGTAKPKKAVYLVCAGRYNSQADAEKHIDTLRKFGYSPKLSFNGQNSYRVVLRQVGGKSKAEKIKSDFEKKGISCFVEEE